MTALTCYRIRPDIEGEADGTFHHLVEHGDHQLVASEPVDGDGFTAQAFLVNTPPHPVPWAAFVQSGFQGLEVGLSASPSAVVIVRTRAPNRRRDRHLMFAFTFGVAGRHLLRDDVYVRGYGLRTALNLLYPRNAFGGARLSPDLAVTVAGVRGG